MDVEFYYPIFDEDLQFDNQKDIKGNLKDILAVVESYQFSKNEDDLNYLAFSNDKGDSFEVGRNGDKYDVNIRVMMEKKILGLFTSRYDKLHEITNCNREDLECHLKTYLHCDKESILKKMKSKSFSS